MDPLLPVDALRFTRDRTELADRIRKLEGRYGIYMPTRSVLEEAQLQRRDLARVRSEVTMSAMKSAAVHLGSMKEGRKSIMFVSEGLPALGMEEYSQLEEMIRTANHNNTAIYTLDPRGLVGGSADVLRSLAEGTGGEAFVETNTPEKALRQVVTDASAFYLLGYSSTKNPQDGKFHSIKVRVKRRGVTVRARKGYWAPTVTELERARTDAAAGEAMPADVTSALAVLSTARADRTVDLWVGTERGSNGLARVTAAWTLRAPASVAQSAALRPNRHRVGHRTRRIAATRSSKRRSTPAVCRFRGRPAFCSCARTCGTRRGTRWTKARGRSPSRTTAARGSRSASRSSFRARNAADAKAIAGAAEMMPFAGREFVRTDRVFVRFAVYGAAAGKALISATLMNGKGSPLLELPVAALPDGRGHVSDRFAAGVERAGRLPHRRRGGARRREGKDAGAAARRPLTTAGGTRRQPAYGFFGPIVR